MLAQRRIAAASAGCPPGLSNCRSPGGHPIFNRLDVPMKEFTRADGAALAVVTGFRERIRSFRPSFTPRPHWTDADHAAAAEKKFQRAQQLAAEIRRWHGDLNGAAILDVGCGDGANCLQLALEPVGQVFGLDLRLPFLDPGEQGEATRRLVRAILAALGLDPDLQRALRRLPLQFVVGDAARMPFRDGSFDVLFSRSAMEHLSPLERALAEMARVVRPGGLLHHRIDPYYWLRGCHRRGLVDIPWAHARLSLAECHRFVADTEGPGRAEERTRRLESLNRLTLRQWRERIAAGPFEILAWHEESSSLAEEMLRQHADVLETLLPGVEERDLVCGRIKVWLRKRRHDPS